MSRIVLVVLCGLSLLIASVIVWVSLPPPETAASVLPSSDEVGIDAHLGATLPRDLTFVDEDGRLVQLSAFIHDKPVIVAPVYYECPMLCNMTMDGLVRCLRGMTQDVGKDFTVITVSFDPREGPELASAAKRTAITRYGREGAETGWHFLTGEEEPIRRLTDTLGFRFKFDEMSQQFVHAAGIFVLSPEGKITRFLGGVDFAPRDMKLALAEANNGQEATFGEQVLLLCFHYDPTEGKYGLAIMRLIRFAGLVTVGALVVGIFYMSRRQQRSNEPTVDERRLERVGG